MKRKDVQALHGKSTQELEKLRAELEMQLNTARIEKHAGKLANTSSIKTTSDQLARVKTILRAQSLAEAVKEAPAEKETKPKAKKTIKKATKKASK